jgi:broad specificity phosphatase PhoE
MEVYLIRHAEVDYTGVADPTTVRLTPNGEEQARRVAEQFAAWDIQFLCASTMVRAEMTADAVSARLPSLLRWDLEELQEMSAADLEGQPTAGPLTSTWTPELLRLGLERTWSRVMAAWARIRLYAETYGMGRVAIISHGYPIKLMLLNWLGYDWRANERLHFPVDFASSSRVTLADGVAASGTTVQFDWLNRLP